MTTIIGIDAATQPKKVGLARGVLDGAELQITDVTLGSGPTSLVDTITAWCGDEDVLLAIDAPLGWPAPLARGLHGHRAGQVLVGDPHDLFRRLTDRFVHEQLGKLPLEVGADRIARTAHAALRLLGEVRGTTGREIPLAWTPELDGTAAIEVYPAASLRCRDTINSGYKGDGDPARANRTSILRALAPEWTLRVDDADLASSDDRLDAAICVLAGADFLRGQCVPPREDQREFAQLEGWIWYRAGRPVR